MIRGSIFPPFHEDEEIPALVTEGWDFSSDPDDKSSKPVERLVAPLTIASHSILRNVSEQIDDD
jgi:hypothetical protein